MASAGLPAGSSPAGPSGRFARRYGTGPWHLLLMVACFAFTGYVASLIASVPQSWRIAVWFLGAAVFHDAVLWPLSALADRIARRGRSRTEATAGAAPRSVPAGRSVPLVNHLRVPTVISAVLLVVSFPLVLHMAHSYRAAVGLAPTPYTVRWLVITACLYGGSALLYAARVSRARRRAGTGA